MDSTAKITAAKLWIVLARCQRTIALAVERGMAELGLCLTDFMVLEALLHKGPLTITEIQAKVLLASGSMTVAVDRREEKGPPARAPAADDRRDKLLRLTPEGKRVVEAAFQRHAAELEASMTV